MEYALLTGLGLAAPAGLNAYIPLLTLALADRATDRVTLHPPYDALSSTPVILLLVVLLTIEIVVDKVPGVDHLNDLVQTIVRPAAGAILMLAAGSSAVELSPVVLAILGILAAGALHAAKAAARPASTLGTAGLFTPFISMGEDALATAASVSAIFAPLLAVVFLVGFVLLAIWLARKAQGRRMA